MVALVGRGAGVERAGNLKQDGKVPAVPSVGERRAIGRLVSRLGHASIVTGGSDSDPPI